MSTVSKKAGCAAALLAGAITLRSDSPSYVPEPPGQARWLSDVHAPRIKEVLVVRGPYLQAASATELTICWRTDRPTESIVVYGEKSHSLNKRAYGLNDTSEHQVLLSNLKPDTKYYYALAMLDGRTLRDEDCFFKTAPVQGTTAPVRIWAIGDFGTGDRHQRAVRDAFLNFSGEKPANLIITVGDNAYDRGTDSQFQGGLFEPYAKMLRNTPMWPAVGNHDADSSDSSTQTGPYFNAFNLPRNGEAGGIASGTEAYYSFDYANVHFICLDTSETEISHSSQMLQWLKRDLEASKAHWRIAYFHHPPYSDGSHDSGEETLSVNARRVIVPVLEQGGVDMVLSGHSHSYECSGLVQGHYGDDFERAPLAQERMGRVFRKDTGPLSGTVYAVVGSSGALDIGPLDHPLMVHSEYARGSMAIDVNGETLEATFIRENGSVGDGFRLIKRFPRTR